MPLRIPRLRLFHRKSKSGSEAKANTADSASVGSLASQDSWTQQGVCVCVCVCVVGVCVGVGVCVCVGGGIPSSRFPLSVLLMCICMLTPLPAESEANGGYVVIKLKDLSKLHKAVWKDDLPKVTSALSGLKKPMYVDYYDKEGR